jgi:uncharacterized membrane protein
MMTRLRRLGPLAIVQAVGAVIALLIALYLAATKLSGGLPACLPGGGCETVALSEYSSIFGVPVAVLGAGFSAVLLGTIVASLLRADRRLLYATYALALLGTVFVAYLTYLELFVIRAICQWCVGYAICTVVTFLTAALRLRQPQD